ncbi:hypothetical protein CCR75_007715 [Bremia lactucae]|uniref:Uncharacterized protein n=1 Tax=Bremia lactucae TaxID=4779 RepID=A0A976IEY9_BRELC|nr:hypothetical protein CCR75_007715 [Bremia lactucae]
MKDDSLSQGAKTLLPMSLGLVAKREKGLQMEATKLEQVFHQRNEMLGALRESHEYLLTANGQLQERNRLQREKLGLLRTRLETYQAQREEIQQGRYKAQGTNELEATAEKCHLLNSVLIALVDKRTGLEQRCMALEEQTSRDKRTLYTKAEQLSEAQCTLLLVREDIRSIQWNYASTQNELTDKDQYLRSVSQHAQQQATILINFEAALKASKTEVEDFQKIWQNCEHMAHEELRQLAIENEYATSKQRDLEKLLGSDGATCLADQEVLQAATELQIHLQQLNAKEERLSWLERHRFHLKNEQCEASKAYAADESGTALFGI